VTDAAPVSGYGPGPGHGADAPIGIFDSGFGGLTVARAVLDQLPHEPVIYLGDTARQPTVRSRSRRSASTRWSAWTISSTWA